MDFAIPRVLSAAATLPGALILVFRVDGEATSSIEVASFMVRLIFGSNEASAFVGFVRDEEKIDEGGVTPPLPFFLMLPGSELILVLPPPMRKNLEDNDKRFVVVELFTLLPFSETRFELLLIVVLGSGTSTHAQQL